MTHDTTVLIENALTWALGQLGSTAYPGRCLAFVEDAYERSNQIEVNGYSSAKEALDGYGAETTPATPPRGALVFYSCEGYVNDTYHDWGHVGISLGDGRVVHAWDTVRIDTYQAVAHLNPPPRWTAPVYVGWAPATQLLHGSKPRQWSP
jgi:cell wall-associated NlpC family hydrolase